MLLFSLLAQRACSLRYTLSKIQHVVRSQCRKSNLDVFSLQEVNSRITNFLSDLVFDDPWSIFFMTVLSPLGYIKVIVYISQLSQQQKKMFSLVPFIYFFSSNSFLSIKDKLMVSFAGVSNICRCVNVRNASPTNSSFPDLFTKAF